MPPKFDIPESHWWQDIEDSLLEGGQGYVDPLGWLELADPALCDNYFPFGSEISLEMTSASALELPQHEEYDFSIASTSDYLSTTSSSSCQSPSSYADMASASTSATASPSQDVSTFHDHTDSYHQSPHPETNNPLKRGFSEAIDDDDSAVAPPAKAPRLRKGGEQSTTSNRRRYPCTKCPGFFAWSNGDLTRHLESLIHKPASHVCEIPSCGKKFTRCDALKRHVKKVHAQGKKTTNKFK